MVKYLKSSSPYAPVNQGFLSSCGLAFILGVLMKYGDVVGDREIPLTDEQYAFHGVLSVILMVSFGTYACFINMEWLCTMTGLYIGCYIGGKLDIPEHLVPGFVFSIMPIFPFILQDSTWNGVRFSGLWQRKVLWIFAHVTFITYFDEFLHETFKDHPNSMIDFLFDTRLTSDIITGTMVYLNYKNKFPKGFNNIVRWECMFTFPLFFGSGYEVSRAVSKQIHKIFLS